MIISNGLSRVGVAGLLLGLSLAVSAREQVTQASADIRRTSYGVPHIRAFDERGLGVGMGYAYAQDNLCLLANEVVTVNGERAKFSGRTKRPCKSATPRQRCVLQLVEYPQAVAASGKAQSPQMQQRLEGYVAGYNRYLKEQGAPAHCQAAWVRPLVVQDLVKLTRRLLVEGGVGQFAEALVGATPPQATADVQSDAKGFALAAVTSNASRWTEAAMPSPWAVTAHSMAVACCWPTRISLAGRHAFLPDAPDHPWPAGCDGRHIAQGCPW